MNCSVPSISSLQLKDVESSGIADQVSQEHMTCAEELELASAQCVPVHGVVTWQPAVGALGGLFLAGGRSG